MKTSEAEPTPMGSPSSTAAEPHTSHCFPLYSLREFENSLGNPVTLQCPGHLKGTTGCASHAEREQSRGGRGWGAECGMGSEVFVFP